MRIEEERKEFSKSERDKLFKDNGIDAKIDKDLNNKRSFTYLAFNNLYAGVSVLRGTEKKATEILRIIERSIKDNFSKGKLTEKDFLLDSIHEKIMQESTFLAGKNFQETFDSIFLSAHGFVYFNPLKSNQFSEKILSKEYNIPKEFVEIQEHITSKYQHLLEFRVNSAELSSIDSLIPDLDYCKERVDKLSKDFNLTDKEKSIYLANTVASNDVVQLLLSFPKIEQILNKSKDIDKEMFDLALAYRFSNTQHFQKADAFLTDFYLKNVSIENPAKMREETIELLKRNNLTKTLEVLSSPLDYVGNEIDPTKSPIDSLRDYGVIASNELFSISLTDFSKFLKDIKEDFKREEKLNGPVSSKNCLQNIIDEKFNSEKEYRPGEKYRIMELLTHPCFLSKSDGLDLSAALSNIYPNLSSFNLEYIILFNDANENDFIDWVLNYSEAKLKYGAPIIEVAGMKKRMLADIEYASEKGVL